MRNRVVAVMLEIVTERLLGDDQAIDAAPVAAIAEMAKNGAGDAEILRAFASAIEMRRWQDEISGRMSHAHGRGDAEKEEICRQAGLLLEEFPELIDQLRTPGRLLSEGGVTEGNRWPCWIECAGMAVARATQNPHYEGEELDFVREIVAVMEEVVSCG